MVAEGPSLGVFHGVAKKSRKESPLPGFAWKQEDVGREVLLWLMVWDILRSEDHS